MNRIAALCFITMLIGSVAPAAMLCDQLHLKIKKQGPLISSKLRLPFVGELDSQRLAAQGFKLKDDQLIDVETKVVVGIVRVLDTRYLFEWASEEYHRSWIRTAGIDDVCMRRILEAPGQMAGKGFYVSTQPFDSWSYGPAMTVFRTRGPLIVLRHAHDTRTTEQVQRYSLAGIDGIAVMGMASWFSIINSRHLRQPETFASVVKDIKAAPSTAANIKLAELNFWRLVWSREQYAIWLSQLPGFLLSSRSIEVNVSNAIRRNNLRVLKLIAQAANSQESTADWLKPEMIKLAQSLKANEIEKFLESEMAKKTQE